MNDVTPLERTIADDLTKPILGAVVTAFIFAVAEETFPKKQRILIFGMLAIGLVGFLTYSRQRRAADFG